MSCCSDLPPYLPPEPERKFKVGDIIVWKGHRPFIGRIKKVLPMYWSDCQWKYVESSNAYYVSPKSNHLHESNIRLADEIEILLLGNKRKVFLPMSKEEIKSYVDAMDYIKHPVPKYLRKQLS